MLESVNPNLLKQINQISKYLTNFSWDELGQHIVNRCLSLILVTLVFIVVLWLGRKIINTGFQHSKKRLSLSGHRLATFNSLAINIFRYTCLFFWLSGLLEILGVPVGTLIAGAGIFSIALGLGAQGFVADVVNGFFILMEQQIDVGDVVEIGNIKGSVTALGLRTTQITSSDGTLNFIPNRSITVVRNFSRNNMVSTVDINIPNDAPLDRIEEIVTTVNKDLEKEADNLIGKPQIVGPVTINGQLVFRVLLTSKNGHQTKLGATALAAYLKAFRQHGISLSIQKDNRK